MSWGLPGIQVWVCLGFFYKSWRMTQTHRDASKILLLLWDMWDAYHPVLTSLNLEKYLSVVCILRLISLHKHFLSGFLLLFRRESHGLHGSSLPKSLHCLQPSFSLRLGETDLSLAIFLRCPQFLLMPCFLFKYLSCKFIWKKVNNFCFESWMLHSYIIVDTSKSISTFVHLCPSCFLGELCFMQVSLGNGWPWSLRDSCQSKLAFCSLCQSMLGDR